MLLSLGLILILALTLAKVCSKLKLPALLGMIFTGIILGPYALNLLDADLLNISADLREIALIIILTRAGLNLDIEKLKEVGIGAVLMSFIPATFEITATVILAPIFFGISYIEAFIMGCVLAAVSPAVIVPKMLKLIDKKTNIKIPQMIMASASVDDIFVIVLFSVALSLSEKADLSSIVTMPITIILGGLFGMILGKLMSIFFKKFHMRDTVKVLILLSISFFLVTLEDYISMSGILAVMVMGIFIKQDYNILASRLSLKFTKLWVFAEIILFVMVGAATNISYAISAGILGILFIFSVLCVRIIGVFVALSPTKLTKKEKLFSAISFIPKATVQAAIGSVPLSMGLACGEIVLTVAVLAILVTAPLGAFLIDLTEDKLLLGE